MACGVALKRSMDLDGLHSPEHGIKRRRTSNVCHHSPYQPAASGFAAQPQQPTTVFDAAANNVRFSTDDLYAALRRQLRSSLRRRRVAENAAAGGDSSPSSNSDASDSERLMDGCAAPTPRRQQQATTLTTKARDAPLFSFGQVHQICDRLLREQENRLTHEYDKILNAKLAEQYDSFVRFTYDQIHRRFDDTSMSYLS